MDTGTWHRLRDLNLKSRIHPVENQNWFLHAPYLVTLPTCVNISEMCLGIRCNSLSSSCINMFCLETHSYVAKHPRFLICLFEWTFWTHLLPLPWLVLPLLTFLGPSGVCCPCQVLSPMIASGGNGYHAEANHPHHVVACPSLKFPLWSPCHISSFGCWV